MEITLHTGPDSNDLIHIDWFNRNNVPQAADLEIIVNSQDTLVIRLNGVVIATIPAKETP